ncbi:hypothetical protein FSARC_13599 [Fusarium sarcochroum]|uniref:Uncharacterized protein n=1 Tax=Fusarium sarcochroum TaxID=1208366 RepID=A0A8H4T0H3_9HYPO|nr:hypothetical protein FSARC_13599 [Fusarium sarcochroum]
MCAQHASDWKKFGVSTWIKFQVNSDPDESIFQPLIPWQHSIRHPFYGKIQNSAHDYMLVIGWETEKIYDTFRLSTDYQKLMANLTTDTAPDIQVIVFGNKMFGIRLTPDTELLTVYWPISTTPETQDAIWKLKKLVHTSASGIINQHHYKKHPCFGWIEGNQTWNGQPVLASVWLHGWKNDESEQKFKSTQGRSVWKGSELTHPLAVDVFQHDLRSLGALGWESTHMPLQLIKLIDEDAI